MKHIEMSRFPTIDMAKTGQNITAIRKRKGLSVKDLQRIFNFSNPTAIYKWQRGEAIPNIDNLVVLAEIFSVPVDEIIIRAS